MKKQVLRISLIVLAGVTLSLSGFAQSNKKSNKDNTTASSNKHEPAKISMFPPAQPGYKQVYIHVPIMANEQDFKVEFFAGIQADVDCNSHFLSGTITEQNLEGWGYTYYKVETNGVMGGTMMACPDEKMKKEFVTMPSKETYYNSKVPVVIYVPENIEVRYRIWAAEPTMTNAKVVK